MKPKKPVKCTSPTLNESPSEKEGKYKRRSPIDTCIASLNESPSEKEGKLKVRAELTYQDGPQ